VVFLERGGLSQMMEALESNPPAASDITNMADYIGIGAGEDEHLKEVALLMCCAPLPDGFVELKHSDGVNVYRCGRGRGVGG